MNTRNLDQVSNLRLLVVVWPSGNMLVSINAFTLPVRRVRLGRVHHLSTEPATQVNLAWVIPLWVGTMSTSKSWAVYTSIM